LGIKSIWRQNSIRYSSTSSPLSVWRAWPGLKYTRELSEKVVLFCAPMSIYIETDLLRQGWDIYRVFQTMGIEWCYIPD
jgi:hypothetical protein